MTKHILDRPKAESQSWLKHAVSIERKGHPAPASLQLQRRQRGALRSRRAAYFLRFDRHADEVLW